MKKFLCFVCALLVIFSCASDPSGGGSGSSSPKVNQNDPAGTLDNTPELKLKLKDMPDSLADESLKLKSILKEAVSLPATNLPDVKGYAWFMMADILQNSGGIQKMFDSMKEMVSGDIPLNQKIVLSNGQNMYAATKVTTDDGSGLRYYYYYYDSMSEMIVKIYLHIYPVGSEMGGELVEDLSMDGGESFFRISASFNTATKDTETSFVVSVSADVTLAYFSKVKWVSSSEVNIINAIIDAGEGSLGSLVVATGNNDNGGVLFYNHSEGDRYYEYYNNKGSMVIQQMIDGVNLYNRSTFNYFTLNPSYSSFTLTRQPTNTNIVTNENWTWFDNQFESIYITNILYNWWLETNNNDNYDSTADISLPYVQYDEAYTWSDYYNTIVPIQFPFVEWEGLNPTHFNFTQSGLIATVSNKLETLYDDWIETVYMDYITNKEIPDSSIFDELTNY